MDFLLVHGTTQSPRGWERLAGALADRGHRVATADLPADRPELGAAEYARLAAEQVTGAVANPVVVAHSGSGLLLPAVGEAVDARRLVWLAAAVPDPSGASLAEEIGAAPGEVFNPEWVSLGEPPTADPVVAAYFLFHDCDLPTLRWALSTLRLFAPAAAYQEAHGAPADGIPSTYVLPRGDRTLRPEWMRAAARQRLGVDPVEIDGGHCPHVSRPEAVADLLMR